MTSLVALANSMRAPRGIRGHLGGHLGVIWTPWTLQKDRLDLHPGMYPASRGGTVYTRARGRRDLGHEEVM